MWLKLKRVATLLIIVSFALPLSKCEYIDKGEQVVDVYYSWDAFLFESGIADLPLVLIAVLPVVLVLLSAVNLPLLQKRILHAVEFVLSLLGMWWLLGVTSVGTPLTTRYGVTEW